MRRFCSPGVVSVRVLDAETEEDAEREEQAEPGESS
jgi:hypothetical protein